MPSPLVFTAGFLPGAVVTAFFIPAVLRTLVSGLAWAARSWTPTQEHPLLHRPASPRGTQVTFFGKVVIKPN